MTFQTLLNEVQKDISNIKSEMAAYQKQPEVKVPPFPTYPLSPELKRLRTHLVQVVKNDVTRLADTPEPVEPYAPESAFIKMWFSRFQAALTPISYAVAEAQEDDILSFPSGKDELFSTILAEIEFLAQNGKRLGLKTQSIPVINRTLDMIRENRMGEATSSMRKISKDKLGNRVTAFMAAQYHYWRAITGHTSSLPDARSVAQQAAIYNDKFDHDVSYKYRYINIVTESNFSGEKTLEYIREYHLLDTEPLQGREGFASDHAAALKSYIILSGISPKYWQNYEISKLLELVRTVPSGVVIYLMFFRQTVLKEIENKNPTFDIFLDVEKHIAQTQQNYTAVKSYIDASKAASEKDNIWTLTHKYVHDLFKVAPVPDFYDVMLFCSLDGRKYIQNTSIEAVVQENNMPQFNYWRNWINCICSDERMSRIDAYPFRQIALNAPVFEKFDRLLEEAKKEEQKATPKNIADIRDYIQAFSYKRLLEIVKGKNAQGLFKAELTEATYYAKKLCVPPEPNIAPSVLIAQLARKGGFHNLDEIVTAFQGHAKVLIDTEVGLPRRIELAEKKLKKSNFIKLRDGEKGFSGKIQYHVRTLWWFYFGLLPLTAITFIAVAASNSRLEALQTFFVLLGGFVGIIFLVNYLSGAKK